MQISTCRGWAFVAFLFVPAACWAVETAGFQWQTVETQGQPEKRHECGVVACEGKLYLIGGRGILPVNIYDPPTRQWSEASKTPLEIHHAQPVVLNGKIYLFGAMTGRYPDEKPLKHVLIYDPGDDRWSEGAKIPWRRRRGSCGTVVHQDKVYMVGGIRDGHQGGFVAWLDEYDPATDTWRKLADAPRARDHFAAAVIDGKIYAAGGRRTSKETGQVFELTIPQVDVYDIQSGTWTTLAEPLPTRRAGTSTVAWDGKLVVIGGESTQKQAHHEVQMYDSATGQWHNLPALVCGRHGTGAVVLDGKIFTCAGCGGQGGDPELDSLEVFGP